MDAPHIVVVVVIVDDEEEEEEDDMENVTVRQDQNIVT